MTNDLIPPLEQSSDLMIIETFNQKELRLPNQFLLNDYRWLDDKEICSDLGVNSSFLRNFKCTRKESFEMIKDRYPGRNLYQAFKMYIHEGDTRIGLLEQLQSFIEIELNTKIQKFLKKRISYIPKDTISLLQFWCWRHHEVVVLPKKQFELIPETVELFFSLAKKENLFSEYKEFEEEIRDKIESIKKDPK